MSDHRFYIKVEFSIYGEDYDWEASLNWDNHDGVIDSRIIDWFERYYNEARAKWDEQNAIDDRAKEARRIEQSERAELARLKAKYEPDADASGVQSPEDWARISTQLGDSLDRVTSDLGPAWTTSYDGAGMVAPVTPWAVEWVNPTPAGELSATGLTCRICGHTVTMKMGESIAGGDPRLCEHLGGPSEYDRPVYDDRATD